MKNAMFSAIIAWTSLIGYEDYSRFLEEPFHYEDDLSAVNEFPSQCEFAALFNVQKFGSLYNLGSEISLFELSSPLLLDGHSYLFSLNQDNGLHFRSFKIDADGGITSWEGNKREVKIRLDQVSEGEIIELQLYDICENKYIDVALTLFPKVYSLGEVGSVKFSSKSPLPFVGLEFEGMVPGEEVIIQGVDEEHQVFKMDEKGRYKSDLNGANWEKTDPLQLRIICSRGEFVCPLILNRVDWSSMPKHDAIIILKTN